MLASVFGRKFEEVLEWVQEQEDEVKDTDVDLQFGNSPTPANPGGTVTAAADTVEDIPEKGDQVWRLLQRLCTGESEGIVVNSGGGFEVWRRLRRRFDPLSAGRKRNLLRAILSPVRVKGWEHVRQAIDQPDDRTGYVWFQESDVPETDESLEEESSRGCDGAGECSETS